MPKRSDREEFSKAFDIENPFEDFTPEETYKALQWGNKPNEIIEIDGPEPLIGLGYLAKIYYYPSGYRKFEDKLIHLAIGQNSNLIYIFPVGEIYIPMFDDSWSNGHLVKRTDYYSNKGGDACYYYHDHEKPYPTIFYHETVSILIPSEYNGKRSYAVVKEGIVG